MIILRTPLSAVAGTPADLFRPTSAGCTAKGGRLNFNRMPCCCHRGAPTKTFVSWLEFSTYNLPTARIFDVLAKALYISVTSRTIAYMLRVFGQCGVLGCPYGTTTSTPTKTACDMRDLPDFREEDKAKGQPPSNWQSPSRGLARGLC
jgi:hypothetical protein